MKTRVTKVYAMWISDGQGNLYELLAGPDGELVMTWDDKGVFTIKGQWSDAA